MMSEAWIDEELLGFWNAETPVLVDEADADLWERGEVWDA